MKNSVLAGLVLVASTLLIPLSAQAAGIASVSPTDDAGGGKTWMAFLSAAIPGLSMQGDQAIGKTTFDLAFFDGEEAPLMAPLTLNRVDPAPVRAAGKPLVAIVSEIQPTDSADGGSEPVTMLSVHQPDGKLVGRVNVTLDRFNGWDEATPVLPVSPSTDVMAIRGSHFNSSQGYDLLALAFVDGSTIKLIDSVFTLSDRGCGYERNQKSRIEAEPGKDAIHGAFKVVVTDETMVTEEDCEDGADIAPSSREIVTHYTWDAATANYVADPEGAKALEDLADDNRGRM